MPTSGFAAHNLAAVFPDRRAANRAADHLRDAGLDDEEIHVLTRDEADPGDRVMGRESTDLPGAATTSIASSVAGGVAGGVAGFLIGAAAFAIPGVGPVLGTGVWAATATGAVAGSTIGFFIGGFKKMWEAQYLDAIREGKVLVVVTTDDPDRIAEAHRSVSEAGAERVDHYDKDGEIVQHSGY